MANKKDEVRTLTMDEYASNLIGAQAGSKLAGKLFGSRKGGSLIAAAAGAKAARNIIKPKMRAKGGAVKKGK
jgi:hypothetical protein